MCAVERQTDTTTKATTICKISNKFKASILSTKLSDAVLRGELIKNILKLLKCYADDFKRCLSNAVSLSLSVALCLSHRASRIRHVVHNIFDAWHFTSDFQPTLDWWLTAIYVCVCGCACVSVWLAAAFLDKESWICDAVATNQIEVDLHSKFAHREKALTAGNITAIVVHVVALHLQSVPLSLNDSHFGKINLKLHNTQIYHFKWKCFGWCGSLILLERILFKFIFLYLNRKISN